MYYLTLFSVVCMHCAGSFVEFDTTANSTDTNYDVHTGDKPYMCSLCNETFSQSGELQTHSDVHSNSRPYLCPYCGKTFKANHHLKCHVRTHTGAKPYSCGHCAERFTRSDQLKRHLLKSHVEGNWSVCNISGTCDMYAIFASAFPNCIQALWVEMHIQYVQKKETKMFFVVSARVRPIPVSGIGYRPILASIGEYRYRPILTWVSALIPVVLSFIYLSQQSIPLQCTPIVSSLYRIFAHISRIHI